MDKLKLLTIEEKIKWTAGRDLWHAFGSEKLGLKELLLADGPHGVRVYSDIVKKEGEHLNRKRLLPSTMFPSACAMASTFNDDLIYEVGKTIGKECNMYGVDILLAPGVNLKRSPLAGRNFEYYSEDPVLTKNMGISFINGVQSTGVGATVKHFAFNEQETNRRYVNTVIDERTAHELYLKPFEEIIKEAEPYCVMTSYNKVNGEYTTESSWLLDILRNKWNYKGVIMSDWNGVQNKVKALLAGTNLEMPGESEFYNDVLESIKSNELTEEVLDKRLLPVFDLYKKLSKNKDKHKETSLEENHEIARKVAEESIVLLKNDNVLPLNIKKIGVIGEFAKRPRVNGGGSVTLRPYTLEIPLVYLEKEYEVAYAQGYQENDTNELLLKEVEEVAKNNDTVIYFTGTTSMMDNEGHDRVNMYLPIGHQEVYKVIRKYAKNVIVILNNGSPLDLRVLQDSDALIESWFLGGANSKVLVDILSGKKNPSGRLSETIPFKLEDTPFYKTFPTQHHDVYYQNDITSLGYRYYDSQGVDVLYPFGYGLSYSTFLYSNLKVSSNSIHETEEITVSVDITNNSKIDGYEVVQLYIEDEESFYPRPKKELRKYKKVFLKSNETTTVSFVLNQSDFSYYGVDYEKYIVEEGYFTIHIGKNVRDILLTERIYIQSDITAPIILKEFHPVNYFIHFKREVMYELIDTYRDFPWYEREEPLNRVLKRIVRDFDISDEKYSEIMNKLLK